MPTSVVLMTADPGLQTAVRRVAALAGVDLEVVNASVGMRAAWRRATTLVVGADLAERAAAAGLPRHPALVVAGLADADDSLWRATVALGAVQLLVLPAADRELLDLLAETAEPDHQASVIGILGGCGGAGASTFACALALLSSRSDPTLLIDGDPIGGGLDALVGAERAAGMRWPDFAETRGRLSPEALLDTVLNIGGCALLSCGRDPTVRIPAEATAAVLGAAVRGCRRVVVDLPRARDDAGDVLFGACDAIVVVVPATVRSVLAASATVAAAGCASAAQLVVRDPAGGRLDAGDVEAATGVRVLTTLRSEAAVASAADRGAPPLRRTRGSLAEACREVLRVLGPEVRAA
ncbi:MAG: hypothetical protein JO214_04700 [Frankiaceae bacterium]|nr:hypothetical protein [Frankiaceae bacterium]